MEAATAASSETEAQFRWITRHYFQQTAGFIVTALRTPNIIYERMF
jgi:hypothetical protein